MDLEAALLTAYAALGRGDPTGALAALEAAPSGRPALVARAAAYRAQALRALGRVEEAEVTVAAAIRLAKAADDPDGVRELRELQASILASVVALRSAAAQRASDAALADTSVAELLAGAADGPERSARLLRKAGALFDAGRAAEGARLARFARDEARGHPREEVLALLAMSRFDPALFAEAHAVADAADDMNLIAAVAQAARAAGRPLAPRGWGD